MKKCKTSLTLETPSHLRLRGMNVWIALKFLHVKSSNAIAYVHTEGEATFTTSPAGIPMHRQTHPEIVDSIQSKSAWVIIILLSFVPTATRPGNEAMCCSSDGCG